MDKYDWIRVLKDAEYDAWSQDDIQISNTFRYLRKAIEKI